MPDAISIHRMRFRSTVDAARARAAEQIDDAELAQAMHELEALRTEKRTHAANELRLGKITAREYQLRLTNIDSELGFQRRPLRTGDKTP
jgi:hypothetical protein